MEKTDADQTRKDIQEHYVFMRFFPLPFCMAMFHPRRMEKKNYTAQINDTLYEDHHKVFVIHPFVPVRRLMLVRSKIL